MRSSPKSSINFAVFLTVLSLGLLISSTSCSSVKPSQSNAQEQTVSAGDNAEVEISSETSQDQETIAKGSKVEADVVEQVITKNLDGIPVWYFLVGCLLFGIIIPQPRFIRWIF